MMVTQWIQVGAEHIALNERGVVCGRLIVIDEELVSQPSKKPHKPNMTARIAMLNDKHRELSRRVSEKRRAKHG